MVEITSGRGTGKSYRQMLLALEAASRGEKVHYWSQSADASEYYWKLAQGLAPNIQYIDKQWKRINFPNGGYLKIMNDTQVNRDRARGIISKEFIDD